MKSLKFECDVFPRLKVLTLLLILACFSVIDSRGQGYYSYNYYMWVNTGNGKNMNYAMAGNIDSFALLNHLSKFSRTTIYHSKRNKVSSTQNIYLYDQQGRCETLISYEDTGVKSTVDFVMKRSFNMHGNMLNNSYQELKGKNVFQVFEYNDSNKLTMTVTQASKKIYAGKIILAYYPTGKMQSIDYKDNKGKTRQKYQYYYQADGQLKQIVLSNGKGKVVRVTDYNCDASGKSLKMIKDTAKVCKEKTYLPDGHIIATTHFFNYKGIPMKSIEERDSQDRLLRYEQYKGVKEVLLYSESYSYDSGKLARYDYKGFYSKRHPYFRSRYYAQNGSILREETHWIKSGKKNKIGITEYIYNDSGKLTRQTTTRDGKVKRESFYNYWYY